MSLAWVLVVLLVHAGVMLGLGHPLPAVLTLGLATALALAGAGVAAIQQWREGKSIDALSSRLAVLEGAHKQLVQDFEALRSQRALERIGG